MLRLQLYQKLHEKLHEPVDAASLAFFRIIFGSVMLFSQVRFLCNGWVKLFYIQPRFYFKYYGFYWVHTLPGNWMYVPWIGMIIALILIITGKYYRAAIISFFLLFGYTELLDLTNYLNHYYLVTLLTFLMIFLPMNAAFSLDSRKYEQPALVPRWTLTVLRLQVGLVYFFAGLSKIKYDWLFRAEPLKIWLGACQNIPVFGKILAMPLTAYIFSWVGMLFDLTAVFFLLNKKTRPYEYVVIVVFHLMTLWLFYIGIFPLIMMGVALVFFSPVFHRKMLEKCFFWLDKTNSQPIVPFTWHKYKTAFACFFTGYFIWQFILPVRYLFYPGNMLWTEQGFRYAWNVMLMEKDGYIEFYVEDKITHKRYIEYPRKYLTPLQERMMDTQPDMILQYAHFLAREYTNDLHHPVAVFADDYVSLNQKSGQAYIDPKIDLSKQEDSFAPKNWILPENNE